MTRGFFHFYQVIGGQVKIIFQEVDLIKSDSFVLGVTNRVQAGLGSLFFSEQSLNRLFLLFRNNKNV